jgi:hypothetical protein
LNCNVGNNAGAQLAAPITVNGVQINDF